MTSLDAVDPSDSILLRTRDARGLTQSRDRDGAVRLRATGALETPPLPHGRGSVASPAGCLYTRSAVKTPGIPSKCDISVVIPLFNEEPNLEELKARLDRVLPEVSDH